MTSLNQIQVLATLLSMNKSRFVPVLTGNTALQRIKVKSITDKELVLVVEAPFVDMKLWQERGAKPYQNIVHSGAVINGETDYALKVNENGGFNRHNKSQYWVNRLCYQSVVDFAKILGNKVVIVNKLPLQV